MVRSRILLEGGGESKETQIRCREAFRKLLEKCGYERRMPRLEACGGRQRAYRDFCLSHSQASEGQFVALLVDSEDPIPNIDAPWQHLKTRDNWDRPQGAVDEQVLLMTTCMETWIAADPASLQAHYGSCLQATALPPLTNMEERTRKSVYDALVHATRNCSEVYAKGANSFKVLSHIEPSAVRDHLPSFQRLQRILDDSL